ncbi:MAG: membrane integrity-associated transporter subunit PqiC [Magnetococcales bacterium]|nr:membrane integrity-associated transporter subunit PqiC [Magnetococcales bacterium]
MMILPHLCRLFPVPGPRSCFFPGRSGLLLAGLLAMVLSGCTAAGGAAGDDSTTRLYLLTPLTDKPPAPLPGSGAAVPAPLVEVAPIVLPGYLNRPQMVSRDGEHQLHASEFNQWGENLADNLTRVVTENLAELLGHGGVYAQSPQIASRSAFRLLIQVARFEPGPTGNITLVARWRLYGPDSSDLLEVRRTVLESATPITAGDYPAMAAAMSRQLADLSGQVATAIVRHHSQRRH